jgi:hypothetical protein
MLLLAQSGHPARRTECPLLGVMSVIGGKADITRTCRNVRSKDDCAESKRPSSFRAYEINTT